MTTIRPDLGRILVVAPAHPSTTDSEAGRAAYALYCGLRDLGCDAHFMAFCRTTDQARLVLPTPTEEIVFYDDNDVDPFFQIAAPELTAAALKAIEACDPTFVSFHQGAPVGANLIRECASRPGTTVTVTLHDYGAICHHGGQMTTRPGRSLCTRASASACNRCFPQISPQAFVIRAETALRNLEGVRSFVAPSHYISDTYIKWGLEKDRVARIENGLIDLPRRAPPSRDEATAVFGFFGHITPNSGVDLLIKAVEFLSESDFIGSVRIYGTISEDARPTMARLEDAATLPKNVQYYSDFSHDQLSRLMADCDYVVVPSIWWESDPAVIQEAYAVGRPVICSNVGGMAEKVRHGQTGLHFRVGDPVDLARVMLDAQSSRIRSALQRQVPRPQSRSDMAKSYLDLFGRL